jgi:hypothetical protein
MSKFRSIGLVLAVVVLASAYFIPLHLQAQVGHGSRGSGGAASAAFNDVTNGTNTQAAMVIGTGASLSTTGSGAITSTRIVNSDNLPATCTQGDVYHDNNATSGARLAVCDSTDTWVTPPHGRWSGYAFRQIPGWSSSLLKRKRSIKPLTKAR